MLKCKKFDITRYKIENKKIKPKKILLITDTHSEAFYYVNIIAKEECVDAIMIAGDVFDNDFVKDDYTDTLKWLTSLTKIAPVFCSFGNHETRRTALSFTKKFLEDAGVKILDNMLTRFDDLLIYGYTPDTSKNSLIFPLEKDNIILLCHMPMDYINHFKDLGLFLTLSGHEHGGQWRFFGRGVFSPSQGVFPKYTSGLLFDNHLIISRGLSNPSLVPKINNKPEVVIIEIN